MRRETVLAYICLGMLQLSQVTHLRTVEKCGDLAKPLYAPHETPEHNLILIQAETCFSKALEKAKKLPPNCEQIVALAWFGMASTMSLGRG